MDQDTLTEIWHRAAGTGATLLEVPGGPRLTYRDAERGSARVANALRHLGITPGERVGAQIDKSPMSVLLYLACLRSGAVLVPINPACTDAEVAYLVDDARPRLLVTDPDRLLHRSGMATLSADATGAGTLADAADAEADSFDDLRPQATDMAAILYTSGTTGRPKGAMLTQGNLASNARSLQQAWGFTSDDILLHALPMFHAHGLFVATNCVLASASTMIYLPRFEVDAVIEHLPRATVLMGVPTFYTRLLAATRLDRERCRTVRLFVSGSAPLPAATHEAWQERTGHAILERYGLTETLMLTSNPLDGERRAGSVGPPLPGVSLRLADRDSRMEAPRGGIGEIEVRGPSVFAGYWGEPELTARELSPDGWFRTGDLGRLGPGGYLDIVGRAKDLVISGGLNVYPKEVEDAIDRVDGVVESAVVGAPDHDFGERVVAVVVLQPGAHLDEPALRARLRQDLAAYKVPKEVLFVDQLPRNAMGKVEKAVLRRRLAPG